ncbi:RNA binding protein La-like protein [Perkinsela sp. CCAP 1560/4]|nr:RNA binding protein La-like protein [Perkinsela sp. CCAP 1560/4]|eukprot:KNH07294.1 RNA binding protein La-like protein [Perkinsela sp. CCAP 1560/4]
MSAEDLHAQIRKQVEFYFCDANLSRDTFMKEKIAENREGSVSISCLLTFRKLATLTTDVEVVAAALKESKPLEVSPDGLSVKRVDPFDDTIDHTKRTSVIFPIPGEATEAEIHGAIKKFCPESAIAAIWRKRRKHPVSKLTMHIAEIHWENEADVALLMEKSENGKQITFPDADDKSEITAMSRESFEAMFAKQAEKPKLVYKGSDYTAADLAKRVIDLSADSSLGPVRYVKQILSEALQASIMYVHIIEGELSRARVMFDTEEACTQALEAYAGAKTKPQEEAPADEKPEGESTIKATVIDDETVLNTVLVGFQERMKAFTTGKKPYGGQKRKPYKGGMGKKKWQRR